MGQTRILVAEGDPVTRLVLADTLKDCGYEVLEAADGDEAIQMIKDPDRVDLIVADLDTPGPDAIAIVDQATAGSSVVPAVYITNRPDLLSAKNPPKPYRILDKPFSLAAVSETVAALIGKP